MEGNAAFQQYYGGDTLGKSDKPKREAKKAKKDVKQKGISTNIIPPPMTVEVIRKERKKRDEDED